MFELGDIVYYTNSSHQEPIGEIGGIRETTWSDKGRDVMYMIRTWRGSVRNIYDENSITNKKPSIIESVN
ncbi:MAG: hypothetical protein CMB52_05630 [Euryarchaeota archaeon]|nr:hypothetical protein [Euryarchaeota archaeon]